jgi:hypothetical protein
MGKERKACCLEKGISWPERRYVGKGKSIEAREYIGFNCFTWEKLVVIYPASPSERAHEYRGYGQSPDYYGSGTGSWFNFYVDLSFIMGVPYDNGPVVEYGHYTKIDPPK